jgi:quinol-cytochrome oxidoreductase complex cytochrome b subunit
MPNPSSSHRRRGIRLWRKNKSLIYNLHPPNIPAAGARWTYTFGLGGLAVLTAIITLITGLLLMFYYVPTVEQTHTSLSYINSVVTLGGFVRSLHFWAAQMMVATVVLHMVRIVFTGGYRSPRDFNWLIGLGLLVIPSCGILPATPCAGTKEASGLYWSAPIY